MTAISGNPGHADVGRPTRGDAVARHVASRASQLQNALLDRGSARRSEAVATLARLRRARTGDIGDPGVWAPVFTAMPGELQGHDDLPSRAERAVFAALVLLAVHLQSANGPRHVERRRLGHAVGSLARSQNAAHPEDTSVARRFQAFATATTWEARITHLRGLIQLMRSAGEALDYGSLARDLYAIQTAAGLRDRRLQWGRDFHRLKNDAGPASDSAAGSDVTGSSEPDGAPGTAEPEGN